jgi:hypothetical protein
MPVETQTEERRTRPSVRDWAPAIFTLPGNHPVGWAIAWTVLLLALILAPESILPDHSIIAKRPYLSRTDLMVHFLLFAGFTWNWLRAGQSSLRWVVVPAVGLLLAVATELAQGLAVIHRDPSVLDTLADGTGVAIAWIATALLARRSARFPGSPQTPVLAEEICGDDLAG